MPVDEPHRVVCHLDLHFAGLQRRAHRRRKVSRGPNNVIVRQVEAQGGLTAHLQILYPRIFHRTMAALLVVQELLLQSLGGVLLCLQIGLERDERPALRQRTCHLVGHQGKQAHAFG